MKTNKITELTQLHKNFILRLDSSCQELLKKLEGLDAKGEGPLFKSLKELRMKLDSTGLNFQRITGCEFYHKDDEVHMHKSYIKLIKIFFLLDSESSRVYAKKINYLMDELLNVLQALSLEMDSLDSKSKTSLEIEMQAIDRQYFSLDSEAGRLIEDLDQAIDYIYENIRDARNKNINLSFLLTSAFLSIILFFPEFNTMINLRDEELSYEQMVDELIYEKLIQELDYKDLIELRKGNDLGGEDDLINSRLIRDIVKEKLDRGNQALKKEKLRISIFFKILLIFLLPYIAWTIFIGI